MELNAVYGQVAMGEPHDCAVFKRRGDLEAFGQ